MPSFRFKIFARKTDGDLHAGGLKFGFFFTVVLIAAINTGNNLTYLVLASLCGAVVVSRLCARLSMSSLSTALRIPDEIYADSETRIDFFVEKGSALMQAHSINLQLRSNAAVRIPHRPYISHMKQGEGRKLQGIYIFPKRGRYGISGIHAVCDFPFGLMALGRLFRRRDELIVFPKLFDLEEAFEHRGDGLKSRDTARKGPDGGLLNIRPFVPGDNYQFLHWKASAKTDVLMIKDMAQEEGQAIWLHFNHLRLPDSPPAEERVFEAAVSLAASLAFHGRALGLRMAFSAPGLRLAPDRNGDHVNIFLTYLAGVKASGTMLGRRPAAAPRRSDETLIIIDPMNEGAAWDPDSQVLDKRYFERLAGESP